MSDLFTTLLGQLEAKRDRNWLRSRYYDAKHQPIDTGMMLPPGMFQRLGTVLGWPAKAVDALAQRVYWQGFASADDAVQADLDELATATRFDSLAAHAVHSAMEQSVSFLVVNRYEDEDVPVVTVKDAMNGTGQWDARAHRLTSFLSVVERDEKSGKPTSAVLYTPESIYEMAWSKIAGWQVAQVSDNELGVVPVEMLAYKPRLHRPFGMSRISRPVMALTDMAVRTVIRSEVGAEFYSIPQRWLLGADESAFGDRADTWRILVGRIMALADSEDENAKNPRAQVGQFPQISMQPHMEQLRSLAQLFAGETSIPVSSLGISIDSNPTSADSYAASREDIIAEAEACIREWRGPFARSMGYALALSGSAPADAHIMTRFRDPRYTSRSSAADAFTKAASVMPWMAQSETAVELLGFDEVTTERLKQDRRRAVGRSVLAAAIEGAQSPTDAVDLKARFDALGVAIRSGVEPEDAAARLNLQGIKFTGAESQADRLE